MDRRPFPCCGRLALLLAVVWPLVAACGCTSALATAYWLVKGPNVDPEFNVLREKRVAVVCRPLDFSQYRSPSAPKDLARQVTNLLQQHVRKIQTIDQRKVEDWMDNNTWDDYLEVGKAVEADIVLGIDLESFSIYQGQTIYQGKANIRMKVFDCKTGAQVVDKSVPQIVYPPNHVRSTSEQQESEFCREFVGILADHIARHFYAHDPREYFAADAAALR